MLQPAETSEHVPVLLAEVVSYLVRSPGGVYLDATVGAGGHAAALLAAAGPEARLLGLDADPGALGVARRNLAEYGGQVELVQSNFRHMASVARRTGLAPFTGILLDLGLSSLQLADAERGFGFRTQGRLDMRFDPAQGVAAAEMLNRLGESEIARLLRDFGEEPAARRVAREIARSRPLRTARDLAEAVTRAVPAARSREDVLARVFMAVRIAVNDEFGALQEGLEQALGLLAPGGRIAVISFHSLEDRIVKRFMARESRGCLCPPGLPACVCGHRASLRLITRKPVVPEEAEVRRNPRSRSAKLRVAERL